MRWFFCDFFIACTDIIFRFSSCSIEWWGRATGPVGAWFHFLGGGKRFSTNFPTHVPQTSVFPAVDDLDGNPEIANSCHSSRVPTLHSEDVWTLYQRKPPMFFLWNNLFQKIFTFVKLVVPKSHDVFLWKTFCSKSVTISPKVGFRGGGDPP